MAKDVALFIGHEVKAITQLIADIDPYFPDEEMFEVLVGAVTAWGVLEAQVLFPALESLFEDAAAMTAPARERLNTLYALEGNIHEGEAAEGPFSELAQKYIDAVKYHLVADIQEILPIAARLDETASVRLANSMAAMKLEME